MTDLAAIVSCIVLLGLAVFQLALIFGAPIGKYAWGGSHKILPTNLRIGSAISILLYGIFAAIVLSKAEIITLFDNRAIADVGIWVLAVYFAVGVLMNGISRSKSERNLMTPVALLLAITTTILALS